MLILSKIFTTHSYVRNPVYKWISLFARNRAVSIHVLHRAHQTSKSRSECLVQGRVMCLTTTLCIKLWLLDHGQLAHYIMSIYSHTLPSCEFSSWCCFSHALWSRVETSLIMDSCSCYNSKCVCCVQLERQVMLLWCSIVHCIRPPLWDLVGSVLWQQETSGAPPYQTAVEKQE